MVWNTLICSECCTVKLCGDLSDLAEYENDIQAKKNVVRERLQEPGRCSPASAAASKTSEDKRLGMELSMIKQRQSRNETRCQWIEGATMPADVLTKGKKRGNVEFLRKLLHTARYQIRATSEMFEERRQARERKLLRPQERRWASI